MITLSSNIITQGGGASDNTTTQGASSYYLTPPRGLSNSSYTLLPSGWLVITNPSGVSYIILTNSPEGVVSYTKSNYLPPCRG